MFFQQLIQRAKCSVVTVMRNLEHRLKQWTKPSSESLVVGTLADVARDKVNSSPRMPCCAIN
jgi:hypothetical protein